MKVKVLSSRLLFIILAAILLSGMSFAGCKAAESGEAVQAVEDAALREADYEASEEVALTADEEYTKESAPEGMGEDSADNGGTEYGDTAITGDRKVIKTAHIEIEVEKGEFEKTMFGLSSLAEQNGGFVSDSQSYSDSEGNLTSGYVTIRVPSGKYSSALERVKEMGTIENISSSGQDITQEYVDLESRLENYEAQRQILLDLMDESRKVSDSLEVQRELSNVQNEIEMIKGRMNYLDDLVSFSTVDIYFHEPEPIKTTSDWGFIEALKGGLRGAVTAFNWMLMTFIATSPVWIILAIILIIVWQVIRARRRRREGKEKK
ncbi:MAG: DUF4349 domain-containing protein [Actinomycetota bacterium]|nr:DUF4349 domain-containing protein [Actinomycetota bacterium]